MEAGQSRGTQSHGRGDTYLEVELSSGEEMVLPVHQSLCGFLRRVEVEESETVHQYQLSIRA